MTQTTIRALRTVVQTAVGIAIALPALVDSGTLPRSLPWVGAALTVAGLLSRTMAVPAVQSLLPAWLTTSDTPGPDAPGPNAPQPDTPEPVALDAANTLTAPAPAPAAHVVD
ncbi:MULTISPECIES: hypothetical protein [unclassified Streptomyces]|uniref:hypothetical protein n=1 Tax=unclassified Streptomyces TaxID=2593676 RepID=UPI00352DA03F